LEIHFNLTLERLIILLKRRRAAAKFGIGFTRSAFFKLPGSINLHGIRHELKLPEENGIRVAFIELLLDDCYGCMSVTEPVKTVLDVGANVGLFGIAARNAFPEATIHAYEPNSYLEPYLKVQAKAGRFRYFMEAVGCEAGRASLSFKDESVLTRSTADQSGDVVQIAFRDAIKRLGGKVDLLKMDCEGAEWGLLGDVEAWSHVKHLSMEYHLWPDHTRGEVLDRVIKLGFKIKKHVSLEGFGLIIATK
jgi:FkbM family methyltransferase